MVKRPKEQLEDFTQQVERAHPDWTARRIETELESLAPVVFGHWKDNTPNSAARLRQIQRWRRGYRNPRLPPTRLPYRYVWPLGERQRNALEPGFLVGRRALHASHRVFLQNCSDETLRELRASLGRTEVAYEPSLAPQRFAEVLWTRNEAIRASALSASSPDPIRIPMRVEFAVSKGTRRAWLAGELLLDPDAGWVSFLSEDGQARDIE